MNPTLLASPSYKVQISGILAGYMGRNEFGQVVFKFDENYWKQNKRPVLSQYFEDNRKQIYKGRSRSLPPFFANLVPEGQMRTLIAHSLDMAEGDADDLALLSAVGDDLPGAVTVNIANELIIFPASSYDSVEQIIPESKPDSDSEAAKLRFSLAGVQMKFSVIRQEEKLAIPARNELGEWIAKVDSLRFPRLTENEFAVMRWALASGFDVPPCELLSRDTLPDSLKQRAPEHTSLFVIKRYDRINGRRIHQEDFAQMLGQMPEKKYDYASYEKCAQLVLNICGPEQYIEFLRRLIFMVASGNVDAHLKNWSILYEDGVNPELTPLYDQVCTVAWPNEIDMRWALNFMKTRDLYSIDNERFMELVKFSGGKGLVSQNIIDETLKSIAEAWHNASIADILPQEHALMLQRYWNRVPILQRFASVVK